MSIAPINKATYSILFGSAPNYSNGYTLLANNGGNIIAPIAPYSLTVNSGFYGIRSDSGAKVIGNIIGTLMYVNPTPTTTQLNALIGTLNNTGNDNVICTGTDQTFYSTKNYTSSISGGGIVISGATLTFDAQNVSSSQFFIISDDFINIANITFILLNGAQADNIFFFANSYIIIKNFNAIQGNLIALLQITIDAAQTINGRIFSQQSNIIFTDGANYIINAELVCYLKGTKLLTDKGYVSVENINVGDYVVSKGKIIDNQSVDVNNKFTIEPIFWIGSFVAPNLTTQTLPICIKANALGNHQPFEDLYVSPSHRIIIDGHMLIARDLVNGTTIFQDMERTSVEYYHLELAEHSSIFANGVLSESYLDINTRRIFNNNASLHIANEFPIVV